MKSHLRHSIENQIVLNRVNERFHESENGTGYLVTRHWDRVLYILTRASSLFNIPTQLECLLQRAHQMIVVLGSDNNSLQRRLFNLTGWRGPPGPLAFFQDFPVMECYNKIPGLSRFSKTCTNPDFDVRSVNKTVKIAANFLGFYTCIGSNKNALYPEGDRGTPIWKSQQWLPSCSMSSMASGCSGQKFL